mgnify:CR=1 FL=1
MRPWQLGGVGVGGCCGNFVGVDVGCTGPEAQIVTKPRSLFGVVCDGVGANGYGVGVVFVFFVGGGIGSVGVGNCFSGP